MDINTATEELVDQAERFAAFTGIIQPNPEDRFFLVMGETGSGKSTFISRCTGKDIPVGDNLYLRKSTPAILSTASRSDRSYKNKRVTSPRIWINRYLRL